MLKKQEEEKKAEELKRKHEEEERVKELEKSQQPMKKLVDQLTDSHSTKFPPRDIINLT